MAFERSRIAISILILSLFIVTIDMMISLNHASAQLNDFKVVVPDFKMRSGQTLTQNINITGSTGFSMIITDITFKQHADWFKVGKDLPLTVQNPKPTQETMFVQIPVTVTVPSNYTGNATISEVISQMAVKARYSESYSTEEDLPIKVIVDNSIDIRPIIAIFGTLGAAIVGAIFYKRRRG